MSSWQLAFAEVPSPGMKTVPFFVLFFFFFMETEEESQMHAVPTVLEYIFLK